MGQDARTHDDDSVLDRRGDGGGGEEKMLHQGVYRSRLEVWCAARGSPPDWTRRTTTTSSAVAPWVALAEAESG